jgi:hypothetical protein
MAATLVEGLWTREQPGTDLLDPPVPLRPPGEVMTPDGLSAFKASPLSFVRPLVRRMVDERWRIERIRWQMDGEGRGTAAYRVATAERPLHFVVYSDNLPPEHKTERIVGHRYDGVGFLGQGEIDDAQIDRLRHETENFVLGRADSSVIGLTRINRSERAFDAAVEALAEGRQPAAMGGYLLRNNGFWGNGRHGTAVFPGFGPEHPLSHPYSGEMFTLYMWRHFANDLVEDIARQRNPNAATLDPGLKRYLGMGNASGLGMVPFVIAHPKRVHAWVMARELAIAWALGEAVAPDAPEVTRLLDLLDRCHAYFTVHDRDGRGMYTPSSVLRDGLQAIRERVAAFRETGEMPGDRGGLPWHALAEWARAELDRECAEVLHSLLIELYPERAECLASLAAVPGDFASDLDPAMSVAALGALLRLDYDWALAIDLSVPGAHHHFWYYSEENVEPRLGERGVDPGDDVEAFVDVPGAVQALRRDLDRFDPEAPVAEVLLRHPEHRYMIERAQQTAGHAYGEVRGHITHRDFQPCHLIRFALSLLGMEDFDPRSKLWVRGTFLQGAPIAEHLVAGREGDWIYPLAPESA